MQITYNNDTDWFFLKADPYRSKRYKERPSEHVPLPGTPTDAAIDLINAGFTDVEVAEAVGSFYDADKVSRLRGRHFLPALSYLINPEPADPRPLAETNHLPDLLREVANKFQSLVLDQLEYGHSLERIATTLRLPLYLLLHLCRGGAYGEVTGIRWRAFEAPLRLEYDRALRDQDPTYRLMRDVQATLILPVEDAAFTTGLSVQQVEHWRGEVF